MRRLSPALASAALIGLGMAGAQLVPADEDEAARKPDPEPEPQGNVQTEDPFKPLTRQQRRYRERMVAKAKR